MDHTWWWKKQINTTLTFYLLFLAFFGTCLKISGSVSVRLMRSRYTVMRCSFCSIVKVFDSFAQFFVISKSWVRISYTARRLMLISSAIILTVKSWSVLTRSLTLETFSSFRYRLDLSKRASSSTSSLPFTNALCHRNICARDIVWCPRACFSFLNVSAAFSLSFIQNLRA